MKIGPYEVHPAAEIFPLMTDEEFSDLVQSIKRDGLDNPIVLHEGKILDGRNRMRACIEAEVAPHFEVFSGESPMDYAIRQNTKRHQYTASQLATVAADAMPRYEAEAAERRSKLALNREAGKRGEAVPARLPELVKGDARDKAAAAVGVSARYASDAKKIKEQSPETFAKLKSGEVTIPQAKREITNRNQPPEKTEKNKSDGSRSESHGLTALKNAWAFTNRNDKKRFCQFLIEHETQLVSWIKNQ